MRRAPSQGRGRIAARTQRHALSQRSNPQFEAPGAHWFVGDGMLHAFHLENGRASYRNRWVRTPKWQAEHDAGRALFGGFGRKLPDAPASITQDGGVANTNIIFHAGRLLALEEGHLPPKSIRARSTGLAIATIMAASPALHRPSQDRSGHRRDGSSATMRRAADPCFVLRIGQCIRRGDALRSL